MRNYNEFDELEKEMRELPKTNLNEQQFHTIHNQVIDFIDRDERKSRRQRLTKRWIISISSVAAVLLIALLSLNEFSGNEDKKIVMQNIDKAPEAVSDEGPMQSVETEDMEQEKKLDIEEIDLTMILNIIIENEGIESIETFKTLLDGETTAHYDSYYDLMPEMDLKELEKVVSDNQMRMDSFDRNGENGWELMQEDLQAAINRFEIVEKSIGDYEALRVWLQDVKTHYKTAQAFDIDEWDTAFLEYTKGTKKLNALEKSVADSEIQLDVTLHEDIILKPEYDSVESWIEAMKEHMANGAPDFWASERDYRFHMAHVVKVYANHFAALSSDKEEIMNLRALAEKTAPLNQIGSNLTDQEQEELYQALITAVNEY